MGIDFSTTNLGGPGGGVGFGVSEGTGLFPNGWLMVEQETRVGEMAEREQ